MNVKSVLLTLVLLASPVLALEPAALLQNHEMVDLAGEEVRLSDFTGEIVIVNFWASWCEPCLRELPELDLWNAEWSEKGARVVAISIDKNEANAHDFVAKNKLKMTVLVDGPSGLARALDLPAVPTSYVLDQEGNVVLRIAGSSDKDLKVMKETVEMLMAQSGKGPEA